ncbi:uncharacterized protein CIMG_01803 [Coccidioides immitis RS]|uniref:TMEM205-like domain-containing protein n=5 Tax=Coccidioides TaxID=5500 RepID=A0A0E1S590_COCIM|nr:uncharacterized protein CIMG_01803 [Coccidioides immitis RS]XP_003065466.1 hypothetical protein CPC735_046910 [Coccidioides posadasii C735 delta SOWgp]KMM64648.1 hypothetical protein CPAG_01000 [Coccidioides posadasii RMSCC 3488]KMP01807.1 hypothetical protein CIRG_01946 [Coccidioides immitis RMSCC 2394]KMU88116.1 hypothetical protein CIHG_05884 [Coccidioides immitis H538.4]TPX25427.1 hypothetical protein DIZ76_010882 [Coccidioides immitis]EAS36449.1 hypothetical protein CIMG_01803 [Coccid|eukprot:XP_003065466.1 hypothetical protein CPC735_046910 [Coccidioides posadasii C735 delta SOWgp]
MAERPGILAPFHIISYGTLLGTQTFQTFVGGIIAFKTLPRPQFAALQSSIFPVYFGLQTLLPLVVAATYPGEQSFGGFGPSSISGVLAEGNRLSTLLPIAVTFVSGLANMLALEPAASKIKTERQRQESIDGKKYYDPGPHSKEMMRLNKSFGRIHGISTLVNLAGLAATLYYGKTLAGRLV